MCHSRNMGLDIRKKKKKRTQIPPVTCSLCDLEPLRVSFLILKMELDTYSMGPCEGYLRSGGGLTQPGTKITAKMLNNW